MSATKTKQEQEIKVEEKKKTEKDYLAIFDTYYKDFNVEGMHDLFEETEHTGRSQEIGRIRRPIFKVEIKGCTECGHPVRVYDPWRGETVCEKCGALPSRIRTDFIDSTPAPNRKIGGAKIDLTREKEVYGNDEEFNKGFEESVKRLEKTPASQYGNKADWRLQQYFETVEMIGSQLQMNKNQIDIIKHVIDTYSLKMFHGWLGHKTIIAGICRYVLCKEGRGRELQFKKKVFKENNLTKQHYETISKNIKRYKIFGH